MSLYDMDHRMRLRALVGKHLGAAHGWVADAIHDALAAEFAVVDAVLARVDPARETSHSYDHVDQLGSWGVCIICGADVEGFETHLADCPLVDVIIARGERVSEMSSS